MIKLGVFYNCDIELENKIQIIKLLFKEKSKKNKYIDHPVHLSFYVFEAESKNLKKILDEFKKIKKNLNPCSNSITNWKVFENDILTKLNTLCLEMELLNNIQSVQIKIVDTLSKFHVKNNSKMNFSGEFLKSYNLFGYPFVGKHWIPHITIGSLDMSLNEIDIQLDKLFSFPKLITINNLNLYLIEDEKHTLIEKIEL
jgi:hypothetical protein